MSDILGRPTVKVEIIYDIGLIYSIRGPAEDMKLDVNYESGRIELHGSWGPGFETTYSLSLRREGRYGHTVDAVSRLAWRSVRSLRLASPRTSTMTADQKDELYQGVQNELGICGCGSPDKALDFVEKILALCNPDKWDELDRELDARNDMRGAFVLYALDNADYIDHGSTIFCSWLTPRGKAVLRFLQVDRYV